MGAGLFAAVMHISDGVIVTTIGSCSTSRRYVFAGPLDRRYLLAALALIGIGYGATLLRLAAARGQLRISLEATGLGAVTNFFDTLGIGSFAPTTAWLKLRSLVPDRFIPATLNAGHCIPTIVEALVFIRLVQVDPWLMIACILSAIAGSFVGAAAVQRVSVQVVQATVGAALIIAAALYAMQNLNLMPGHRQCADLGARCSSSSPSRRTSCWAP